MLAGVDVINDRGQIRDRIDIVSELVGTKVSNVFNDVDAGTGIGLGNPEALIVADGNLIAIAVLHHRRVHRPGVTLRTG